MASKAPLLEDLPMEEEEEEERRPPLNRALLHRSSANNTSQVAMVGSNPCPIESLDYEMIENELFDQNWRTRSKADQVRYVVFKWTFCFAIGILTGIVGFVVNLAVENVAGFKLEAVSALMDDSSYWTASWVFAASNLVLLLLASSITAFVSPAAGGSGIPEVKAYLNGVDAPNIFSLRTLAVKVVGNIAAVSSSLHVGKAGPMVHTGACIAAIFGQGGSRKYGLTCRWLRYFKNDRDRRDLVTIGAGAGVAAAFRAPVGGVLFALESLSSWWRSALIWRSFFTTAVVAVVLRLFIELCGSGRCGMFGQGGLIMYDVSTMFDDLMTYHLKDIPTVILIGITGALLGALYNFLMERVLRVYNIINELIDLQERRSAQAAVSGHRLHHNVMLRLRPAVAGALSAMPHDGAAFVARRNLPRAEPFPAVPMPSGPLQRPCESVPQHQRRRHPQPLLHRHQRRVPPGFHGHLLRGVLRPGRAQLRRGGAFGPVRPHHPHRRHVRAPRGHAAGQPLRPGPWPRRHPRLRVLPRRDAPDDHVRVRHHPGAHQQPAPAAAHHARAAHLQDGGRLLQLQHLRPHPAPQGPAPPGRARRAVHAAADRGRRGGRAAAELQRRGEGREHRAHAPDHGPPRVPRRGRAALLAGAGALRAGAARAPAGAAQEEGVPGGAGAVPQGVRRREVPGGGLRQARVREAGHHRRRAAVAGGDGDVRGPAPLHQHVALHSGRDDVTGQGARALPGGRPAPPPRRAQGLRQVAGGRHLDKARLHARAHPGAAPRAAGKPLEQAPVAEGRRGQVLPLPHRVGRQQRLIEACRYIHCWQDAGQCK